MVCADFSFAFGEPPSSWPPLLGGGGGVAAVGSECMAARNAGGLFCVLPFVRQRGAGFFQLSIGRDAARSWIHCALLFSAWISPRHGRGISPIARQPVPPAMGMVLHLLRVPCREDHRWRARVAQLYSDGRVLPERSAAHVDRLVHAASAALVPCFDSFCDAGARTGFGLDIVSAAPLANRVLLYCDSLANWSYFHRQLHVSKLPCPDAGTPFAG